MVLAIDVALSSLFLYLLSLSLLSHLFSLSHAEVYVCACEINDGILTKKLKIKNDIALH